jgi:potassium efflux system protein
MIVTQNRPLLALVLTCLVCVSLSLGTATALESSPDPDAGAPTVEEIMALRETAEADASLAEREQARVLRLYDLALRSMRVAERLRAEAARVREESNAAPALIARAEELVATPEGDPQARGVSPERIAQLSEEALAARVEQVQRELDAAIDQRRTIGRRFEAEVLAPLAPSADTADALGAQAGEGSPDLPSSATGGTESKDVLAQRMLAGARAVERRARRELDRARSASYGLLSRLNFARAAVVRREFQRAARDLDVLADALARREIASARAESEAARATHASVAGLPAPLRELASENLALREELEGLLATVADAATGRRAERLRAVVLEEQITTDRARLEIFGPTVEVARLILDRIEDIPSRAELEQAAATREAAKAAAVNWRLQLERRYRRISNPERVVATVLAAIPAAERTELGEAWLAGQALELIEDEMASFAALHTLIGGYLRVLARTDESAHRVRTAAEAFARFARTDLLWVRNLQSIAPRDVRQLDDALAELTSGSEWRRTLRSAAESFGVNPGISFTLLTALVLLVLYRGRARRTLDRSSEQIRHARTDGYRHTVRALVNTVALAAPWPLALVWVGWLAVSEPWSGRFSVAAGQAATAAGLALVAISVAYRAARPEGLARHFRWPQAPCLAVRRELRWFAPLFVAATGLVVLAAVLDSEAVTLAVGRPAMIVSCLASTVFTWRLLGSGRALRSHLDSLEPPPPVARWRGAWYPLVLGVPLLFAAGSALGYHHPAVELAPVLVNTLWVGLGLFLVREMLLRWFYVSQRRLKLEARLERMAQDREESETEHGAEQGIEIEEAAVDFEALYEQARSVVLGGLLIGAALGLWALWGDLVPALGFAEHLELPFNRIALVDGIERAVPVTIWDLLVAVAVFAVAFYAARNLAGLLGFTVLRRLDAGASYAVVTLCQYALIAFGVVYASSAIGLQWSKLQWLVAALGVGLGFGLQEIVANFVSGIILLLERPVRVGDIVTVGDADGKVARIQIRATTIVTWERKELVIPNKEFITGRVLNWTLSDTKLRLFIPVDIAYGSDVRRARELILEAATENENVLEDPAPSVHFGAFGNDALNLELRCFVPSIDARLPTNTAVHDAIYDKFAEAGITIAFPQRDVHLDLTGPLDVQVNGAEAVQRQQENEERSPSGRAGRRAPPVPGDTKG